MKNRNYIPKLRFYTPFSIKLFVHTCTMFCNIFHVQCCFKCYLFCSICGTLHSVDQFLNIKLTDIQVTDPDKYPHMVGLFLSVTKQLHFTSILLIKCLNNTHKVFNHDCLTQIKSCTNELDAGNTEETKSIIQRMIHLR